MAIATTVTVNGSSYNLQDTVYDLATTELAGLMSAADKTKLDSLLDLIYPVGSIYMSMIDNSPANFIGGTWSRISGGFLYGADTATSTGNGTGTSTGATTLTVAQLPSHTHTFTGSSATSGNNSAGHTHTFDDYYPSSIGGTTLTAAQTGVQSHAHTVNSHSHTVSANFYIRHGKAYDVESVAAGSNTSIDKGAYTDTWTTAYSTQGYSHKPDKVAISLTTGASSPGTSSTTAAAASASHNHSIGTSNETRTSSDISANHTHSVTAAGSNANTGGGGSHTHVIPYIAPYIWKRTE